jgi:hypothetical protein
MRNAKTKKKRFAFGLMKPVAALFVFFFINAAPAITGGNPVKKEEGLKNITTEKLAAQFREMRTIKGHFDGGEWNDEADQWMGRKHRLMIELGNRLANNKFPRQDVLKLLGQPDQIARKGDELFKRLTERPGACPPTEEADELPVYYWRGTHDLLFFCSVNGRIVHSGWWYAGE